MLTCEAIELAKLNGTLVPVQPIVAWEGSPRALLMCAQLWEAVQEGRQAASEKERQMWARLEAAFSFFVEGGLITADFLKQLRPKKFEHWEIRSRRPRPSLRVFGRFALPDVFVATHVKHRMELGGMNSRQFEHEKLVCEDHWRQAGLPDTPFTDAPKFRYTEYVTFNAREKLRV